MNKKEFEDKFETGNGLICPYDLAIQNDVNNIWQWIEQYGKEQGIDELEKFLDNFGINKVGVLPTFVRVIAENRIKELKDE